MRKKPPVKIDRKALATMAAYEPAVAGRLLSWGWRCHEGEQINVEDEIACDPGARHALVIGSEMLDATLLADGIIGISAFLTARQKAESISVVRRQAREARFAQADSNVVALHAQGGRRTKGGHAPRPAASTISPALLAGINEFQSQGMEPHIARQLAHELASTYSPEEIASAATRMRGRAIANPSRYIRRMLDNDRRQVKPAVPTKGARPVRRVVSVSHGAGYQLLGWTSREHPRGNGTPEGRLKVWRTDSGKLAYKKPDEDETPPDFTEDPGLYEID